MYRQSEKNLLSGNTSFICPHNMANFGPQTAEIGLPVWGTPTFQRVSRLAFVTAATSLTGGQPNFARCLAVSCAGTLYMHFGGLLPVTEFCPVQHSLYVPNLALSYIGSVTARHTSGGVSQTLRRGTRNGITELSQRAPPIFGWAAITFDIGPHSSLRSTVGGIVSAPVRSRSR